MRTLEADYLVVGAGAGGMAFTDTLVAHAPEAEVVVVDRRHRPGGHWVDAYPFVRLHLPSASYGVSSRRLGTDSLQATGPEAGMYERATGDEIRDYFGRVLDEDLLPTGRVTFLAMHDYAGAPGGVHTAVSTLTGEPVEVTVRRRLVDATYLEGSIPATHTPSYEVAPGARVIPVNALSSVREPRDRYVVLGGGKTAIDACLWLLDNGVDPERIRWVRPRDAWILDRATLQPRSLVGQTLEGFADDLEALAASASYEELIPALEERGRLVRIDPDVEPEMYHCGSISAHERERLREIRDVVRLGRAVRVEPGRLVLQHGELDATPGDLYVDCTAAALRQRRPRPVFEPDRVTVQMVQHCSPTFNAALLGYVEATRDDVEHQNRLCPPNPLPDVPRDWVRMLATTLRATGQWRAESDLRDWAESTRLNIFSARGHEDDPRVKAARGRIRSALGPAAARLGELLAAT